MPAKRLELVRGLDVAAGTIVVRHDDSAPVFF